MKRLWIWFQSLTRFKQIGLSVLFAHTLILLALSFSHLLSGSPKVKKSIAIRTTLLPRTVPIQTVKKPLPEKKKISPPSVATKKGVAPPSQKAVAQNKQTNDLLTQIAESLEAIATIPKTPNILLPLPPSIQIQTGETVLTEYPNYSETVSAILQNSLDLPEFGKVVVKIEIDGDGHVIQCQILDSQSRKNGEFLKKRLQELSFPCFNQYGIKENQLNFTVTFQNAENI